MFYIIELLEFAMKNLARHKLRSFLTTLGIIFGIGAVVSMMSIGSGAQGKILEQIKKMGTTNILIHTVKPPEEKKAGSDDDGGSINKYGLTFKDATYFKTILTSAKAILQIHRVSTKVYYKNRVLEPKIYGVPYDYFATLNKTVSVGRELNPADYPQARRVCIIAPGILRELAYVGDPLNLSIRIGSNFFRVIGVIKEESSDSSLLSEGDSLHIYMPFATSVKRYGTFSIKRKKGSREIKQVQLNQIIISCKEVEDVLDMALVVSSILKNFHGKRDYEISVPLKKLRQAQETQRIFQIVMIMIAAISLLVGGIGIANIMFANVTERTREIGIRRALGATKRDIMLQFLCETIVISIIGGFLGCLVGIAGTFGIEKFTGWQSEISIPAMLFTLIISCLIGILSGIAPAHYAARGTPISSLRRE